MGRVASGAPTNHLLPPGCGGGSTSRGVGSGGRDAERPLHSNDPLRKVLNPLRKLWLGEEDTLSLFSLRRSPDDASLPIPNCSGGRTEGISQASVRRWFLLQETCGPDMGHSGSVPPAAEANELRHGQLRPLLSCLAFLVSGLAFLVSGLQVCGP